MSIPTNPDPNLSPSTPQPSSGKATASLVLSLLSIVFCCLTSIPAIILGVMAKSDIKASMGRITGGGQATAGIIIGSIITALSVISIPINIALLLPAIQAARGAARQASCQNNMKQIGLALAGYEMQYGTFPPAYFADADGKPMHSWRVMLLPFLGRVDLYDRYDFNEPWDGPNNSQLVNQMPDVFKCPGDDTLTPGETNYMAVIGPGLGFSSDKSLRMSDIADGMSNTVFVVDSPVPHNWLDPNDIDEATFTASLAEGGGPATTLHRDGAIVLFADGSASLLPKGTPPEVVHSLLTPAGND